MDYKFCPKCGNKMPSNALFCNSCGEKFPIAQQESSNVVNSSSIENELKDCEEQYESDDDDSEVQEESQMKETISFFAKVVSYCVLLYLFCDISLIGVIILAAIAYLSYKFFVIKFFISKNWSMKFAPELCSIIGFLVISALLGNGSGSSSFSYNSIDESEFGTYEFADDFNTWELTINKDKTCTMLNKSKGDGVYCYGSWSHFSYEEKNSSMYKLSFTDLVPRVWFEGELEMTNMYYPVLEAKGKYIYMNASAYDAQNPNRRIPVRKTK